MNEGEGWWRGGLGAKETDVECRVESWWTSFDFLSAGVILKARMVCTCLLLGGGV